MRKRVVFFSILGTLAFAAGAATAVFTSKSTVTATVTVPYTIGDQTGVVTAHSEISVPTVTETVTVTETTPPTTTDTTTDTTPVPTGCAVSGSNVPDGSDGRGGCFPGPSSTGPNAPQSSMAAYTGSCTITVANTVIDSKVVRCTDLDVRATGFQLKNSYLFGAVHGGSGFTITDSLIDGANSRGYACINCGVDGTSFTILRTEIIHTNRAAYCEQTCNVRDNYFHAVNLEPVASNQAHASGMRVEQNAQVIHNTLACDFKGPFPNSEIGCSADLTGYPDFAPIKNNTIEGNLFIENNIGNGFCAYGGGTAGKPYSGDATNATNIVFRNNVFQRGQNGKCGDYGPITDFKSGRTGNIWTGNVFDNGSVVNPG